VLEVTPENATFRRVPDWSAAWNAGVAAGDVLQGVDTSDILSRTGAPPHMRPFLAGRRLLSGPANVPRTFTVQTRNHDLVTFTDAPVFTPWRDPVEWHVRPSGSGYIRLAGFPPGTNERIDAALRELENCERLIVDLRGNCGGLLVEALDFRDRFVDAPMQMGWIQFSTPSGGLSRLDPIHASPTQKFIHWEGQVAFLVDPLTASASEDALLGLSGLPQVKLIGTRTAGGSGRARSIPLLPGIRLSVSTALTYDRSGRCIEGNGLPPDIPVSIETVFNDAELLRLADTTW
jgi:carboxyl-terminal processing protease